MPYKCEKLKIPQKHDKRRKLSDVEKIEIKELYGKVSQRKLAKAYGVSRRLIIFIGCPEKYAKNLADRKASGGSKQYYDKKKHTRAMRKHRKRKQELYLEGKLEKKINEKVR